MSFPWERERTQNLHHNSLPLLRYSHFTGQKGHMAKPSSGVEKCIPFVGKRKEREYMLNKNAPVKNYFSTSQFVSLVMNSLVSEKSDHK